MKRYSSVMLGLLFFLLAACSLDPAIKMNVEAGGEESVDELRQLMDGAYDDMGDSDYMGRDFIMAGEVRADNVFANNATGRFSDLSKMDLQSTNGTVSNLFRRIYATTANPNIVLAVDMDEIEGSDEDKAQILGEAYAVRAMAHFDLIRLFGQAYINGGDNLGMPYLKAFKDGDLQKPRGTLDENKQDLYADVEEAITYFKQAEGSQWAKDKTNFTLDAAYALKSRMGTYFKDYDKVIEASEKLYGKYTVTDAHDWVEYWELQDPPPASILELENNADDNPGIDGLANIYRVFETGYGDIQVFSNFVENAGFDDGDVRASEAMIGLEDGRLRNMGKYPSDGSMPGLVRGEDNIKVFRYAEVVLNYAEALLDRDSGKALELLNEIATHRNAKPYTQANVDNILKERRKELVFEGFRFFDLARFHREIPQIDQNAANRHGDVAAGSARFVFPIPQQELDTNKNMEPNPNN